MTQSTLNDYQDSGRIDHTDAETLHRLYHEEGLSQPEIADMSDVTHQTIDYHMRKHDIERRDRIESCRQKSRVEYAQRYMGSQGYINYRDTWTEDDRQISLHRLLAIAEYGVSEVAEKHVHHKNGIPWDNRPDNIELMTPAEHARHHHKQRSAGSTD